MKRLAAILILMCGPAFAVNYWAGRYTPTKWVSPTGSGTACTTGSPCSLSYAVANLSGTTVGAIPGTYNMGGTYLSFSGSNIILTCQTTAGVDSPASWAFFAGGPTCYLTSTYGSDTLAASGSNDTLDGWNITTGLGTGSGPNQLAYVTGNGWVFSRDVMHDDQPTPTSNGGGAIQLGSSTGSITFDAGVIYNICNWGSANSGCNISSGNGHIQYDGLLFESTSSSLNVTNSIIYNTGSLSGLNIGIGGSTGGCGNVSNNLIFSTLKVGAGLFSLGCATTLNNNIITNIGTGVYNSGDPHGAISLAAYGPTMNTSLLTASHNALGSPASNPLGNWYATGQSCGSINSSTGVCGSWSPSGTVTSGVQFVNWQATGGGDYHEAVGSSTIGTGTATGCPGHDFDGNLRSGSCDIGPYQFASTPPPPTTPFLILGGQQ